MSAGDTPSSMLRWQAAALREAGGAQRLSMAFELTRMARELTMAGLRARRPDLGAEQLADEYARIVLGPELAERLFKYRQSRDAGDSQR